MEALLPQLFANLSGVGSTLILAGRVLHASMVWVELKPTGQAYEMQLLAYAKNARLNIVILQLHAYSLVIICSSCYGTGVPCPGPDEFSD